MASAWARSDAIAGTTRATHATAEPLRLLRDEPLRQLGLAAPEERLGGDGPRSSMS
jgi:hypothetical protein